MSQQPSIWSDPIGYFREGAERTAAEAGKDKYGQQNDPGWFNNLVGSLTGATDAGTQEYRDLAQRETLKGQYGSQLSLYGAAEVGLGEDEGTVQQRLRTAKENYDSAQRKKGYDELYNRPQEVEKRRVEAERFNEDRKRQDRQFAASRQDVANQMELTRLQMARADKNSMLDRADAREAKAAELEYAKLRDRKADQQYNERMEQLDRRDRRQGITSIAAGLAALGAAFAL